MAALVLSGCGTSRQISAELQRELPAEPAFAKKVRVSHTEDEDPLLAAGRERAGRARANDVIVCFVEWYRQVKADYGADKTERSASSALHSCEEKLP